MSTISPSTSPRPVERSLPEPVPPAAAPGPASPRAPQAGPGVPADGFKHVAAADLPFKPWPAPAASVPPANSQSASAPGAWTVSAPRAMEAGLRENGSALASAPDSLQRDPQLMLLALENGLPPSRIHPDLLADPRAAAAALQIQPEVLQHLPPQLREDPQILQACVSGFRRQQRRTGYNQALDDRVVASLQSVPPEALKNPEVAARLFELFDAHGARPLQALGLGPQLSDRQWMLSVMDQVKDPDYEPGCSFKLASDELKRDPAFQREAVLRYPSLLNHDKLQRWYGLADERLRGDRPLMEQLVQQNPYSYFSASPELKRDPAFAEKAWHGDLELSCLLRTGQWGPDQPLHRNPELLGMLLRRDPGCLKQTISPEKLQNPDLRDLLDESIARDPELLAKGSDAMKNDRELVLTALRSLPLDGRQTAGALVGQALRRDPGFASEANQLCPGLIPPAQPMPPPPPPESIQFTREVQLNPDLPQAGLDERSRTMNELLLGHMKLKEAPAELQKDRGVALAYLRAGKTSAGSRVTSIQSASWRGSKPADYAAERRGLLHESAEHQWSCVDPSLRQDRTFQRQAVLANAELLSQVDPALRSDKAFVLEVVRRRGDVLEHASEALRSDPDVVRAAVQSEGTAIQFAGGALKRDKSLGLAAVHDDNGAYKHLDPQLKSDPDIVLEAVRMRLGADFRDLWELPKTLTEDRPFMLRLAQTNVRAVDNMVSSVADEPDFRAEVAMGFPPVLDTWTEAEKQSAFRVRPELRERYADVKRQLQQLGIENPMRLRSSKLLDEVLRNRLDPAAASKDPRPTALVVLPKSAADERHAFNFNNLDELTRGYRVMYYEAGTDGAVIEAMRDGSQARPAALMVLGGHGDHFGINMGRSHYAKASEALDVDLSDESQMRQAGLEKALRPDASIVLLSCSTGEGEIAANNPANMMSRVFPGREVYAPVVPILSKMKFDEQGVFTDPGYTGGLDVTYRVRTNPP